MGLDLGQEFGLNENAEIDGVWINLGDGAAIKLARIGNREAMKAWKKIPHAIRNQLDRDVLEVGPTEDFLVRFLAEHIVKGWRNLIDGGEEIPYSIDNSIKMMKKHKRFRDRIQELALDSDHFNIESEKDAKNSPARSVGT